jgi:hypothetical protein
LARDRRSEPALPWHYSRLLQPAVGDAAVQMKSSTLIDEMGGSLRRSTMRRSLFLVARSIICRTESGDMGVDAMLVSPKAT